MASTRRPSRPGYERTWNVGPGKRANCRKKRSRGASPVHGFILADGDWGAFSGGGAVGVKGGTVARQPAPLRGRAGARPFEADFSAGSQDFRAGGAGGEIWFDRRTTNEDRHAASGGWDSVARRKRSLRAMMPGPSDGPERYLYPRSGRRGNCGVGRVDTRDSGGEGPAPMYSVRPRCARSRGAMGRPALARWRGASGSTAPRRRSLGEHRRIPRRSLMCSRRYRWGGDLCGHAVQGGQPQGLSVSVAGVPRAPRNPSVAKLPRSTTWTLASASNYGWCCDATINCDTW